jgi:hypothetical protein
MIRAKRVFPMLRCNTVIGPFPSDAQLFSLAPFKPLKFLFI